MLFCVHILGRPLASLLENHTGASLQESGMTSGLFLDHVFEEEVLKMKVGKGQSHRVHSAGNTSVSAHVY